MKKYVAALDRYGNLWFSMNTFNTKEEAEEFWKKHHDKDVSSFVGVAELHYDFKNYDENGRIIHASKVTQPSHKK